MLALTGTTGKVGGAILSAILDQTHPPSDLLIRTSSDTSGPKFNTFKSSGIQIQYSNYDDPTSMVTAFTCATIILLIPTPGNNLDYNNAPHGHGREKHHFAAIDAARKVGVKYIAYASLAFGLKSEAGVMKAHRRNEEYLKGLTDVKWTILQKEVYQEN